MSILSLLSGCKRPRT